MSRQDQIGILKRLLHYVDTRTTAMADAPWQNDVSVYTDTDHEYEAVVVDPSSGSLVDQFSLPASEWAQSMPLSRFRLVGSSLYELGSTDQGAFVDRYDLGVS